MMKAFFKLFEILLIISLILLCVGTALALIIAPMMMTVQWVFGS